MFEVISDYSTNQLVILGIASLIMGMSRGGIGGGFGLVGVLLAAQIMPPLTAAAFLPSRSAACTTNPNLDTRLCID